MTSASGLLKPKSGAVRIVNFELGIPIPNPGHFLNLEIPGLGGSNPRISGLTISLISM
jgi:hypothetical protein